MGCTSHESLHLRWKDMAVLSWACHLSRNGYGYILLLLLLLLCLGT